MERTNRSRLAPLALLILILSAGPAAAEILPLTLFQRTGRSPWVILGEVVSGEERLVTVRVQEVIKGEYDRPTLRLVFRLKNFMRESWEEKLKFEDGENVLLFLKRHESDREDGKLPKDLQDEDIFASSFGAMGKFTVPEEGGQAYLEAIREFARVSVMQDIEAQERALLSFLEARNPHLVQAGFEQVLDRRLAGEAQVELLLELSDSTSDSIRLNAMQILGQIAEDLSASGRKLADQENFVNRMKAKVMGDGSDVYRAEAVKVISALAGESEREFLERVSKEDRSQIVRYQATSALLDLGG